LRENLRELGKLEKQNVIKTLDCNKFPEGSNIGRFSP
jgi:hypothetical protein